MANYYGTARTNFFRLKDEAAVAKLEEWCALTGNELHTHPTETLCFMVSGQQDSGGFNFFAVDEDDCDLELWWTDICHLLADGEVIVAMEAGAEKLRYVSGAATAIRKDGEFVQLSLGDIYKLAYEKLGVMPNPAEYQATSKKED